MPRELPDIKVVTNKNNDVGLLSKERPVLLVFLRHFGCTFCREAMEDISAQRKNIEAKGVQIIPVHMAKDDLAKAYFTTYKIEDLESVSDPECRVYAKFGLLKGTFKQLFGLRSWIRGFETGVVKGHGVGMMMGDGFQMPGVFLLKDGMIVQEFIHKFASDRPDYNELIQCCMAS